MNQPCLLGSLAFFLAAIVMPASADTTPVTVTIRNAQGRPVLDGNIEVRRITTSEATKQSGSGFLTPDNNGTVELALPRGRYSVYYWSQGVRFEEVLVNGTPVAQPIIDVGEHPVQVQFVVPSFHGIRGTVRDLRGSPVSRVRIYAYVPGQELYLTTRTDAHEDGTFTIITEELPLVVIPVARSEKLVIEPSSTTVTDPRVALHFVAKPDEGRMIQGRVIDATTAQPLPEFSVVVSTQCEGVRLDRVRRIIERETHYATTDASGSFSIRCPQLCPFTVRAYRIRSEYQEAQASFLPGTCPSDILFEVDRGAVLSGTVMNGRKKPIKDLPLVLKGRSSTTDSDGRFRFDGLRPGEYTVRINERAASPDQDGLVLEMEQVTLDLGGQVDVTLTAVRGGNICVSITDELGGLIPIGTVEVYDPTEDELVFQRAIHESTDREEPNVLCTERIPPGEYRILALGKRFQPTWWPGIADGLLARLVTVEPDETTTLTPLVVCEDYDQRASGRCAPRSPEVDE